MDTFTCICARGTEDALLSELLALGLDAESDAGVVVVHGDLEAAYRTILWSRITGRVLVPIAQFKADDPDALYEAGRKVDWEDHFGLNDTFAINVAVAHGKEGHTRYLAQRTKDAIVDTFREQHGERPSVDTYNPAIRFHLHWAETCTLSVDLAGPLHKRGYRPQGAPAPLRETLAAALLRMSGWKPGQPLLDPMCGSGTFLVEAASMARDRAPGLGRRLGSWRGHQRDVYAGLQRDAETRFSSTAGGELRIAGRDRDPEVIALCKESLALAGIAGVDVKCAEFADATPPWHDVQDGHIILNPPYGERLGDRGELIQLYPQIGDILKQRFGGWQAHILTGDKHLAGRIGLRTHKRQPVYNGSLECMFGSYDVRAAKSTDAPGWRKPSRQASMFENRLTKNVKKLRGWAKGANLEAYRVYDADIPEYNVAIDVYGEHVLLQEHRRPLKVDAGVADRRLADAIEIAARVLGVDDEQVHVRVRHRQSGARAFARSGDSRDGDSRSGQYEKRASTGERIVVNEGACRFEVNLIDYLDTGLFLDHRTLRKTAAKASINPATKTGTFLNLFAYTCTASVVAAKKGARVTSVDLSGRYLDWGRANFEQNGLNPSEHDFVRSDVVRWLEHHRGRYHCVLLAPPSYSRSKGMVDELDLKRDHPILIADAYNCVAPGGTLFFSTHARGFELQAGLAEQFNGVEITQSTVPRDFPGGPHRTWRFVRDQ